ncbi:MAG: FxDxF family PEP-CTERM protein [Burkholderiaceae bacterium]
MKLKMFSAAILLALGTPVMAASCLHDSNLGEVGGTPVSFASQCGRLPFASAAFTDHYSFSLSSLGDVTGGLVNFWLWSNNDVNFSSVAITGGGYSGTDSNVADGFSFAGLSAGTYDLAVSGYLGRGEYLGGYTGAISSTATVAAPVPEPETYAMLMLGLAGVGFAARRRNKA